MNIMNILSLVFGLSYLIIVPIVILQKRFLPNMLEDLYEWWDGETLESPEMFLLFLIIFLHLMLSLLMAGLWFVFIPILLIIFLVNHIRNKRIKNKLG